MIPCKHTNEYGFSHLFVVLSILVIGVISVAGYRVYHLNKRSSDNSKFTSGNLDTLGQNKTSPPNPQPNLAANVPPSPAPPPPQHAASPAPAPTAPAQKTESQFTTSIKIKGDTSCQTLTLAALKLLHDKAPTHYSVAITNISIIECQAQGSGMYAYENPPRYVVGSATVNAGTVWYAGTIAHDAGHSKLYHDYLAAHPGTSVPDDVWTGTTAEKTCLEAQYNALSKIGATQYQLNYVQNVINSDYYNILYDQRWW